MTFRPFVLLKQASTVAIGLGIALLFSVNLSSLVLPNLYQPNHIKITGLDEQDQLYLDRVWIDQVEVAGHPMQRFTKHQTLQPSHSSAVDETVRYRDQVAIQFKCLNNRTAVAIESSTLTTQHINDQCQTERIIIPAPKNNHRIFLGVHFIFFVICLVMLRLVMNRISVLPTNHSDVSPPAFGNYLLFMFPPIVVSMMLFWPGHFCNDVLDQINQIETHTFSNLHPVIHTLMLAPFFKIGQPMFYVGLLYGALISLGLGILWVFKTKLSPLSAYIFIFLTFYNPALLIIMTTYWKDVPFSLALVGSCVWLYHLVQHKNNHQKALPVILFSVLLFLVATLRHNGIISYAVLVLLAWVNDIKIKKQILVFSLGLFITWQILLRLLIPQVNPLDFSTFTALHYLSGYALTHPSAPQINSLVDLLSTNQLSGYSSWNSNWLVLNNSINHQNVMTFKLQVYADLISIIIRDPIAVWEIFLERVGYAIFLLYDGRPVYWMQFENLSDHYVRNPFGLDYPAREIRGWLFELVNSRVVPFFWSISALYLVMMFLFVANKNKLQLATLFFPILIQYPLILLTAPGPDYRYFFFMLLIGPFAIALLFNWLEKYINQNYWAK